MTIKLAKPQKFFKNVEDFEKPSQKIQKLGKEAFCSALNDSNPKQDEIDRTIDINSIFSLRNIRQLTEIYNEAGLIIFKDIFDSFIKIIITEFDIESLNNVSLSEYNWDCRLLYTGFKLERIQDVNLIQRNENGKRGGFR